MGSWRNVMKVEVFPDVDSVAGEAAAIVAAEARLATCVRGNFVMALSGGPTPWLMLRALAREDVPWESVHVVQVDERVAPEGDPDRNLTHLRESLLSHAPLSVDRIHAMPGEDVDLAAGARNSPIQPTRVASSTPRPSRSLRNTGSV